MNEYSGWFFTYNSFSRYFGTHHLTGLTPLGVVTAALLVIAMYKAIKYGINYYRGKQLAKSLIVPEGPHKGSEDTQG
ncbi:hypothetical protein vBYpPT3_00002 [Yersinia phage vB_YpP_T3]|uniref:Uncharacterized protein n=1 Tax=Yersinia phage vB_YpP_T3 TaxID=2736204 RepID=A0A7D3QMM1_9CAUD|nr:hypothetical protein vBYpPT3_00002 [Yersinia phage vB_YpP_T3]